jgi:hypothetical protein
LVFRSDTTFPAVPQVQNAARSWAEDALHEWEASDNLSAALEVCENLVAFFLLHGSGDIHVALSTGPNRIAITVSRQDVRQADGALHESERALLDHVSAAATEWGVRQDATGRTTIWAEVC